MRAPSPIVLTGLLFACVSAPPSSSTTPSSTAGPRSPCDDAEALAVRTATLAEWFGALTDGVAEHPVDVVLADGGNGTLQVGLHPDALPVLVGSAGVHVAATAIGAGRVVAFSGQDFLSSGDRSTLLGEPEVQRLLRNAVAWAGGGTGTPLDLLVHSDAVAAILTDGTGHNATTTPVIETVGLRAIQDWSAAALAGHDVLVVQINEWGTLKLADEHLPAVRSFVQAGGGLLISGAALHWSWWLSDQGPAFPGDALLEDVGITWDPVSVGDLTDAVLQFDDLSAPEALWCAWVSGASVDDATLPRLAPLFEQAADAGRSQEVDAGLTRLVDEAPPLPVSADLGAARLSADVGMLLQGQSWPAGHPWATTFPGRVAPRAVRVALEVEIDPGWTRTRPLRAYAAPGDAVTITIAEEHVGTGLAVQVGDLYDDLRGLDHIDTWHRPPLLHQTQSLQAASTTVGAGLGGPLYLLVPDGYAAGPIRVALTGVVPMAVYSDDTPLGFAEDLDRGAPLAILERPGHGSMVVDRDAARDADPAEAMAFWAAFYTSHADLAQEPVPRTWVSHWLFDPQVGWGYANATSARIAFPALATGWALRTQTGDEDWWLFGHELGHQFQTADWSGGDVTEVCVNLWTMYTLNSIIHGGGNLETRGHQGNTIDHAALASMRWGQAGLFDKLELYRQLVFEFGWDTYREVMGSYYDPAYPRDRYGSFMDGFALRFSAISGRDITPFLDHWEYPLSSQARLEVQSWGLETWLPPGW